MNDDSRATPLLDDSLLNFPEPPQSGKQGALRLLLADDHAILREGLRALLELDPGFTVVGEASSCDEALAKIAATQPDVVLCDIGMPGRSGLSAIADARRIAPATRIILLTAHSTQEYISAALDAQADGYVLKDSGHAELVLAIRTVAAGQPYLCRAIAKVVLATYMGRGAERQEAKSPLQQVTNREMQVLSRIASGHTNKAVARELDLSVKTVEKHRANMMRKLSLHNTSDIARFALNAGLIGAVLGEGLPMFHQILDLLAL
jgi:DNA-binding NarL/FixJ family response regulator